MKQTFAELFRPGLSTLFRRLLGNEQVRQAEGSLRMLNNGHVQNKQLTVAVEGNIGSGKTTFLTHFKKYPNLHIVEEPIHHWQNVRGGHNLLDLMYADASRWSFTFQSFVQLTMVRAHTEQHKMPLKLMERSIYSAKYCFVENLYRSGKMVESEYVVLTEWFDWINANLNTNLDLVVYLRTEPEVVHERIVRRNRSEETRIALDYVRALHELHDAWLLHDAFGRLSYPVLVLDANLPADVLRKQYDAHRHTILFTQPLDKREFR